MFPNISEIKLSERRIPDSLTRNLRHKIGRRVQRVSMLVSKHALHMQIQAKAL